jgi:hypothetical protein
MGYTNITNKSQMWHSNMDGLELVFFYFFFILSVFYQFIYYIFVFLFVVFKLDEFIKLSRVNDSNLEFSIYLFFFMNVCVTLTFFLHDEKKNRIAHDTPWAPCLVED